MMNDSPHLSDCRTIAALQADHGVYLVQHSVSGKIYVRKTLSVYNLAVYQCLAQNPCPGIPRIHDLREENGQLTVLESYISGRPLSELTVSCDLNPESVYHYMKDLCAILDRLHSLWPPVIHRDIKPSNIIITEYGHAVLLDFNAARFYTEGESDTVLLGTRGYAAPEQYGFGVSSPRTDIYALGILLKEMAAALPVPTGLFDPIIEKCIRMDPQDRYDSAAGLSRALDAVFSAKNSRVSETTGPSEKPFRSDSFRQPGSSRQPVNSPAPGGLRRFLPPGFRSLTPWKMILSSSLYLFIFWLCFSLEVQNAAGPVLWLNRIFCLFVMLSIIFGCFNYLNVQKYFPLCRHRNRLLHYLGILLLNLTLTFSLLLIMMILESIMLS